MKQGWTKNLIQEVCLVTDYVANGSFKSLKDNVQYNYEKDYAILLRTTDYVKNWKKGFVYVSKDSYEFLKKSSLNIGDIVISSVGNPGITFKVPDLGLPMTLGPNSILVRSLDETNLTHDFIYYLFNSPIGKDLIDSITTGTTQSKFNKTNFRNLSIQVPPLEEQKQIVAKLDQCFEAIDKAKANAAKNLENAKELFQSKLNDIFSQKGEGWVEKKLGDVCSLEYGKPLPKEDRDPDGLYPAYGANGIKTRTDKFLVNGRSIIVGRKGSAGEINYTEDKFWALDVTYYTKFDSNILDLDFLYYLLSLLKLPKLAKGVKPGINRNDVYAITIQLPPLKEQSKIAIEMKHLGNITNSLESKYQQELNSLEELKKSILQKAFEGEL
jgi:type I restriction enzyme S subunit